MDHNIQLTLPPNKPANSIAKAFMMSYTPTADWDTRISLRSPIEKDGMLCLHVYGATTQKYTINILWIIDCRYD